MSAALDGGIHQAAVQGGLVGASPIRRGRWDTLSPMSSSSGIVWLNTRETAQRLGVTPRTLYRFIDDGQLPAYRFGRVIRLKEVEVETFIESCRIQPGTLDSAYHEEVIDIEDTTLSPSSRR